MGTLRGETRKLIFLMMAFCFFSAGSASRCLGAEAQATTVPVEVQQLAVMPFLIGSTEAQQKEKKLEKNLDCQLRGLCALEGDLFPEAEETMTKLVQAEMRRKFGDKIMPLARVRSDYSTIQKNPTDTPREIAVRLGQSLGVDHVLLGLVWRYQERVGSALGASEPASVAFSLFMVNVATQKLVWEGSFDKTQTGLSENLFDTPMFLKKGLKWLTAEELSSYGIQKILTKLSIK